ncbi:MAG: hypothetical protein LH615_15650 [Ferruginibacter sp.]|nr:hypothetical protein [Ferruginibacter sp.]
MTTGVHISGENNEQSLLQAAIKNISKNNADDTFILFTEKIVEQLPTNCKQFLITPKPKNKLLLHYWYNYKLPKLLLKYAVNVFVSDAAMLAPSLSITQFLFFSDTIFEKYKNVFFKKKIIAAINAAENIFVTDDYIAALLTEKYKIHGNKITPLYFDLSSKNASLGWNDLEAIKELYSDGIDYYLFPVSDGSSKKIITVLKAFSQFKKWQKSSMKLLLLLDNIAEENLISDFKNYKYRNDVKIITQDDENVLPIVAASFAVVFFGGYTDVDVAFSALQNNIPVIAADNKANNLLFKNAVLYSDVSENELAIKIQLIYKDELQKNVLIQQSSSLLEKYNTVEAAQKIAQIISA